MHIHLTRRHFIAGGLAFAASPARAARRTYELVPTGSRIAFVFTASGTAQTGTVPVSTADITVDTRNLTRSSADVTADIRNVSSGLVFITQAIKSADLLDAANHPTVRFTSTKIRLGAKGRISAGAEIDGNLTLRGITKPITLQAALSRPAGTKPDDLSILYIKLNGTLRRSDFGASGYPGLAEDQVALDIQAELRAQG